MVRSTDGDTPFFETTTGVLQGDLLALFIFIICLDYSIYIYKYILKTSLNNDRELGFTLTERRNRRYPSEQITDIDYTYDIALTSNRYYK